MIIKKLNLENSFHKRLHVRQDYFPKHQNLWHYHEEIEFIYITKGTGTLFVGDCIQHFHENCCALIGPDVPHYWFFEGSNSLEENNIDCIVIHFKPDFLGNDFYLLDETKKLQNLLTRSNKTLFLNSCPDTFAALFNNILKEKDILKITNLFEALYYFDQSNPEQLISDNYSILHHSIDQKRMNEVIGYIKDNYRGKVELDCLAEMSKMTKNSFCRYFKQKTGKTPIQFVSELRVSHACRLLKGSDKNLKEICFESGFNNFVNFHKIFRNVTNTSPKQYRISSVSNQQF